MQKQIDICSTCRFGVRNYYTSAIGNIPWCCEKHWHCKPGSLASDYVPKPEPKFDGVEYRRHTCPHCQHEWLEDRDASDYPNYCPACGEPLGKED